MLKHNLILAIRKFKQYKTSFSINLLGLSTGLTCTLLIFLWVQDELKVDTFSAHDNRLYKVMHNFEMKPGEILTWHNTSSLLASALMEEFPEVEIATYTNNDFFTPKGILKFGNQTVEVKGLFSDANYFKVFTYPLLFGNSNQVLNGKNNIVLSEKIAKNLFENPEKAIGQTIEWKNRFFEETFYITGVYSNPPANATRQFDVVVPFDWLVDFDRWAGDWTGDYAESFAILKEGTDIKAFQEKIGPFLRPKSEFRKSSTLFIQQYSEQYLYGNFENGKQVGGRIAYVKLFSLIAVFILLIACINFMNLSTAQASTKMKEIGVKKAIGASRFSLIWQYLGEAILLAVFSSVLALAFVNLLLPAFNQWTGKFLFLSWDLELVVACVSITLLTGILAGSYPALFLSGFNPIKVLKGQFTSTFRTQFIRQGLVVFQFGLTIIFMVAVLVIHQQMKYTQTKHLGYDRENVITFQRVKNTGDPQTFLNELRNIPGIVSAGNMVGSILDGDDHQAGYSWRGEEADKSQIIKAPMVGYEMIETLGMELIMGRTFSSQMKDDENKIILNESALKLMQLDNPIGYQIDKGDEKREIVGVVKDFHYGSIHHKVEPLIFRFRDFGRDINVRIKASKEQRVIPKIATLFQQFHPDYDFNYTFLDADYQSLYEAESRVAALSKYFSGLAILISCLGLFGLAMFTAERRKKEISIRKVLGASVLGIVQMLTKEFSKTVIVAILIALPISYFVVINWLNNFAYTIELNAWYFVLPGIVVLLIAWLTVGVQTLQAAKSNPIYSLKED